MNNKPVMPPKRRLSQGEAPSLESVTSNTKKLPSRIIVHALQKWGKTSWAAQAPDPIFIMTRGEDGLLTLIDSGQLPPTKHFPEPVQTWLDLKICLNELIVKEHKYKTVVLDTINGSERLAVEHKMETDHDGSFEKFDAYGRGGQRLLPCIIELTQLLDRLREKGMACILLAHSVVKNVKNPEGLDYPRWEPPLYKETQEHLDRWADAILFGKFETFVEGDNAKATKGKARGGQQRLLMTESDATYSAGNRLGLCQEIECGESAAEAWAAFMEAMKKK
jgi:AAA domain